MEAVALVEDDVENHGDAAFVALVDEAAIVVGRAVGLIGGEIEIGIVAPGVVAVEFHDRQEFDGIDAQVEEVVEFRNYALDGAFAAGLAFGAGEVTNQQFVDYEVALRDALEVGHLPVVIVHLRVENGYGGATDMCRGVGRHIREHVGRDIAVVVGVEDQTGIGVAYGRDAVHDIIIYVVGAGSEAGDGGPEVVDAVLDGLVHVGRGSECIIVPRTDEHDALFARSTDGEGHATVGISHGTLDNLAAGVGNYGCRGGAYNPQVARDGVAAADGCGCHGVVALPCE